MTVECSHLGREASLPDIAVNLVSMGDGFHNMLPGCNVAGRVPRY